MLNHTLAQTCKRLAEGSVTSVQLTQAALSRASALKGTNAFLTIAEDVAMEQARQSDLRRSRQRPFSAIDGIPIAVKDNFSTRNVRTTAGSKMLDLYNPPFDATVVARLCNGSDATGVAHQTQINGSGAVMIGKATLDEFSMGSFNMNSPFPLPTNPLNLDAIDCDDSLVCGGSSGGSAAAVSSYSVFGFVCFVFLLFSPLTPLQNQ